MNWKKLIYPLDGEMATLSEHRNMHHLALTGWAFLIVLLAIVVLM